MKIFQVGPNQFLIMKFTLIFIIFIEINEIERYNWNLQQGIW